MNPAVTIKDAAKKIITVFLPVFFISIFSCSGFAEEQGEVDWYSYDEGIAKMQSEDKNGFLHFYTDWCTYCKKIDEETFSVKYVSDYLNDNYVPIKVNAEEQKDLAREYGANQFPSNLFLSTDTEVIAGRPGYIPREQMIGILKYIHTESYETMTFEDFLENTDDPAAP